jgi:hypothetical protein
MRLGIEWEDFLDQIMQQVLRLVLISEVVGITALGLEDV